MVQMFIFEGTAYSLVSGAVGVGLGLGASSIIVFMANRIFQSGGTGAPESFTMFIHFDPRSAVVAYCLGMVITLATVAISAYRVSRLNIVAAVRGLPAPVEQSQIPYNKRLLAPCEALVRPALLFGFGLLALVRMDISKGFGLLVTSAWAAVILPVRLIITIGQAIWVPMSHGWMTMVAGGLFVWIGVASKEVAPLSVGITLVIIGIGLSLRTISYRIGVQADVADRIAYTFMGLVTLMYWILPSSVLRGIFGDTEGGIEMFFISGVAMVAAAVWTVMYNADLLLVVLTYVAKPFGWFRPVAVSYTHLTLPTTP